MAAGAGTLVRNKLSPATMHGRSVAAACDVAVAEDSRYQIDVANGLRITNITTSDDGEYTCRAEVDEDGRYDERKITVKVHSKCCTVLQSPHAPPAHALSARCSLVFSCAEANDL